MAHEADDAGREGQVAWRYVKLRDFARISGESFAAQRSREWFAQRKAFNRQKGLTSSQWASLFFVKSQEDFQFRYDVIYNGAKDPPDAMGREAMAWGTKMEDAAILAFLRAHPEYIITEAPFTEAHIPGYAASPDGYYFNTKTLETGCIEVKCPFKKGTKKHHSKPVWYYYCQMFAHMLTSNMTTCMFISYGVNGLRSWKIEWDDNLWMQMVLLKEDFVRQNYARFLLTRSKLTAIIEHAVMHSQEV